MAILNLTSISYQQINYYYVNLSQRHQLKMQVEILRFQNYCWVVVLEDHQMLLNCCSVKYYMFEQSQPQIAEESPTSRTDIAHNASLIISALEEEHDNNEQQIGFMEKFIQQKQAEVANLQTFLLTELQTMENCRTRNKHIQKIMITDALPTLSSIKTALQSIKVIIAPICQTAVNFIEILAQKSRQLLVEKEEESKRQREEIVCLKKTISQMRRDYDQLRHRSEQKIEISKQGLNLQTEKWSVENLNKKQVKSILMEGETHPTITQIEQIQQKTNQSSLLPRLQSQAKFNYIEPEESPAPFFGKVDNQSSKYQQCYNYIQENKKNIRYRCERVAMSPLSSNIHSSQSLKKNKEQIHQKTKDTCCGGQRKDFIKQKIKKIKIKAQGRQNRNPSPLNDKKKQWPKQ